MSQKLLTEAEWRKRTVVRKRTSPLCWGARCYDPHAAKRRVLHSRSVRLGLVLTSLLTSVLLPLWIPRPLDETFAEQTAIQASQQPVLRNVSEITYEIPPMETKRHIFPRSELARGKMMLLDELHPLPQDMPAPNTFSIARTANGAVPVRSLEIKTGQQTIDALADLFRQLRNQQADGLCVSQGTMTIVQQKRTRIALLRRLMASYPPETAAAMTLQTLETPGCSELLQEYAVEFAPIQTHAVYEAPENHPQGQLLLRLAWRYGFVRTDRRHPWRFRYVGKAHAAAMTYLDADLPAYLEWLHQKEKLVITDGDQPVYLILCTPLSGGYAAFDLPEGCAYEISLDNTGYALAACTLTGKDGEASK